MSTRQSSPPALRIPQSTVVFVILILVLGALVLSSNSIDQRASVRAEFTLTPSLTPTPVDPFKSLEYIPWRSPNGLFSFEMPRLWTVRPNPQSGPLDYVVLVDERSPARMGIFFQPIQELNLANLPAGARPEEVLRRFMAELASAARQSPATPDPALNIRTVQVADLQGATAHEKVTQPDPASGQEVNYERDWYFLALDAKTVIIVNGSSTAADWPKMQGVMDRLIKSFQMDAPSVLRALAAVSGTPAATSAAAPARTAAPTRAATVNPAPATPAATAAATRNP